MTLPQAIQHLQEILEDPNYFSCEECRQEHEQLLAWLIELYSRRLRDKEIRLGQI